MFSKPTSTNDASLPSTDVPVTLLNVRETKSVGPKVVASILVLIASY